MIEPSRSDSGLSENATDFRRAFVCRVHEILDGGYKRLKPELLAGEEEPAITGDLRDAMTAFLKDDAAPDWADLFSIHDDPPVSDGHRRGKARNRLDIRVDTSQPRPGASFAVEAKRLARGFTVGKYLGKDGLRCFLCGDYARNEDDAGMVGYMQTNDARYWSREIATKMQKDCASHELVDGEEWRSCVFPRGPEHVFVSKHKRTALGRPIMIYHTLLAFHAVEDNREQCG